MLSGKRMVEQINTFAFRSFSQCYYYFYFSTGYFWLFYNRILSLFTNEHPAENCLAA